MEVHTHVFPMIYVVNGTKGDWIKHNRKVESSKKKTNTASLTLTMENK